MRWERTPRAGVLSVFVMAVMLGACAGSGGHSSANRADNSADNATTTGAPANSASGDGSVRTTGSSLGTGSVKVTGAISGTFDTVTNCSIQGGGSGMMVLQMTGNVGGPKTTLTLDSDKLALGVTRYPTGGNPALRSDVLPADASKGSWQFFANKPANVIGAYTGGVISVTKVQGTKLDVTIGAQYGTTDASGPIRLDGEFKCEQQLSP